ncbi:MAG TPA: TRAP transporter fused permease subunit [Stellaceae bacterium]|nr:TRAP transporter fused permease subunit [Stellaceae bacterium]
MTRAAQHLKTVCLAALPLMAVAWILNLPVRLGIGIIGEQFVLVVAGVAVAAAFLQRPYGKEPALPDLALALLALASWGWAALHYSEWLIDAANRGPEKWLPGAVALLLLLECMRRNCGLPITLLMAAVGLYGFLGHLMPGLFEADYIAPTRMVLYLYADQNGVPGVVLSIASTVVLAFIVFSKCLEITGAGRFFDQIALALLGTYRGGPAKVAIVSSGLFGMISGSAIANVMSSGAVTIPMMKRAGFSPSMAGGIEAVASHAGQITPPVMGTTAFLIAEFLQIGYGDVVLAAAIPAALFYLVLYCQVDAYAARKGLRGLARAELPPLGSVIAKGYIFAIAIAALFFFMFWRGTQEALAALYAGAVMLVLSLVAQRRRPSLADLKALTVGVGADMLPILLISAGAGIVIGTLNLTGLGFHVTDVLARVATHWGVVAMLAVTAVVAIILGMGMPTAAVYVILSVILAPALVKLGIMPLAAHMFIFYLGLISFLTPPVAMSSYAAAALAGADLWRTSWDALRIGTSGYLLPFVFALNPALLLHGSVVEILYAVATVALSGTWLSWGSEGSIGAARVGLLARLVLLAGALVIGSSTIWLGPASPSNLLVLAIGLALVAAIHRLSAGRLPAPRVT